MDVQQMLDRKKDLQCNILEFFDDDENNDFILEYLDSKSIHENTNEIKELLHLLLKISKYHYRNTGFRDKITKIILHYKNEILQSFSNYEIFNFFKHDKQILLILFENKILIADSTISDVIQSNFNKYCDFFYPELKPFLKNYYKSPLNIDPDFEQKRRKGENDLYVCKLIREDLIDEFVIYVNQTNISLHKTLITPSIYETNCLIQNKNLTFIEYAAFYGSIQIFNFLRLNGVILTPSLWIYSIHGKNPEIIHLLEEYHVDIDSNITKKFTNILITSIKCHHDDITKYIIDNIIIKYQKIYNVKESFNDNIVTYCIHYYNYEFMPDNLTDSFIIYNLCKYGHISFVKILFDKRLMKLKMKKIHDFFCFNRVSYYYLLLFYTNIFFE